MALGPRIDLRVSQSLVMSQQLQAAIKLLALSNLEIEAVIAEELANNPLLEARPRDGAAESDIIIRTDRETGDEAAEPSIMLLDEPFAGIDPISISDIRDLVIELKQRDIGVLITDHNVRETLDIVDRACIIYGGQVLFEGTPQALVADQNVRRLYLGESFAL